MELVFVPKGFDLFELSRTGEFFELGGVGALLG